MQRTKFSAFTIYCLNLSIYFISILNAQLFVNTEITLRCKVPTRNVKFSKRFQLANSIPRENKFDCSILMLWKYFCILWKRFALKIAYLQGNYCTIKKRGVLKIIEKSKESTWENFMMSKSLFYWFWLLKEIDNLLFHE